MESCLPPPSCGAVPAEALEQTNVSHSPQMAHGSRENGVRGNNSGLVAYCLPIASSSERRGLGRMRSWHLAVPGHHGILGESPRDRIDHKESVKESDGRLIAVTSFRAERGIWH